jgi:glutamate-1-semialdehyde aminotransferase
MFDLKKYIMASKTALFSIQRSEALWKRALELIPSGTQCYSKGPTLYTRGVAPIYLQRGDGCRVWDVDCNEFVDLGMGLWAVTLGHNHPAHVAALGKALREGTQMTLMQPQEVEVAEALTDVIPCAEMVRYGKNGSDVTTAAVRLARACTGRDVILRSGYHGWHDWYVALTDRNRGVPEFNKLLSGRFDENDRQGFDALMARHEGKVAAVVMEGVQSKTADREFLKHVREQTRKRGALLVFDEVINGWRFAIGGAHEWLGVDADLATFGKGMANGTPLSALVGKREFMKELDTTFFSFTFGGETLGLAAVLAVLEVYRREAVVQRLWEVGQKLHTGAQCAIDAHGLGAWIELTPHPVRTFWTFREPYRGCEGDLLKTLFQQEVLRRGVLWAGWHALSLSLANDVSAVERVLTAYDEALAVVQKAVANQSVRAQLQGEPITPVFRRH